MKYVIIIARVLLGLVFVVFGSNAFLHFIPAPPMQGGAGAFVGALINSGYVTPSRFFRSSGPFYNGVVTQKLSPARHEVLRSVGSLAVNAAI
jgi:hypothetical protein